MSLSSELIVISEKRVRVQVPDIKDVRVIDFAITPSGVSVEIGNDGYIAMSMTHDELRDVCLNIIQALPEKKVTR